MNNFPTLPLLAVGTLALLACGSEDPAAVDPAAEAVISAESAAALTAATEVAGPVTDRDRADADVMGAVRDAYGRRMSCASMSLAAGVLEVDFGAGCTIHGHAVAGAFSVAHTQTSSGASFTVTLDDLATDGVVRDGTVQLSAERGAGEVEADATLMVTDGAVTTEHLFSATIDPDPTGVGLDGAASRDDGATARDLEFTGIYVVYGECYPNAGQVTVDAAGQPTTTVTFSAATPATGEVMVQVGRLPAQTVALPSCPR